MESQPPAKRTAVNGIPGGPTSARRLRDSWTPTTPGPCQGCLASQFQEALALALAQEPLSTPDSLSHGFYQELSDEPRPPPLRDAVLLSPRTGMIRSDLGTCVSRNTDVVFWFSRTNIQI